MNSPLLRAILHNLGVLVVSAAFAFLGLGVDAAFGLPRIGGSMAQPLGVLLATLGFLVRVWATRDFYRQQMDVIRLEPQHALFTSGAYAWSRNPLYLGGNVFAFLGMSLIARSWGGVLLTAADIVIVDVFMIRREERQLSAQFGAAWAEYAGRVRRWI